jgi:hypothetical protein
MSGPQSFQVMAQNVRAGVYVSNLPSHPTPAHEAKIKADDEERTKIIADGIAAMKEKSAAKTPEDKAAAQKKLDDANARSEAMDEKFLKEEARRPQRPVDDYGGRRRKSRKGRKSRRRTTRRR